MLDKKAVEARLPALMAEAEAYFLVQGIPPEEVDDATFYNYMWKQLTQDEQLAYLGIASWEQLDKEAALAQLSCALGDIHGGEGTITLDHGDPEIGQRVAMIKRVIREHDEAVAAKAYWADDSDDC